MWHALTAGRRSLQGYLALLLLAPLRTCRLHIAPGTTRKAHEAAATHLHPQTVLAVGAVEGAQGAQHLRCEYEGTTSDRIDIFGISSGKGESSESL